MVVVVVVMVVVAVVVVVEEERISKCITRNNYSFEMNEKERRKECQLQCARKETITTY